MKWLPWIVLGFLALVGWNWHAASVGRLEGEIKARGESIKQLSELAAKKQQVYQKARAKYVANPTLETCSVVLLTCEDRHQDDSTRIDLLSKQVESYKKIQNKGKLFGVLPRPVVGVGVSWCPPKSPACVFGGFPILK